MGEIVTLQKMTNAARQVFVGLFPKELVIKNLLAHHWEGPQGKGKHEAVACGNFYPAQGSAENMEREPRDLSAQPDLALLQRDPDLSSLSSFASGGLSGATIATGLGIKLLS